MLGTLVAGRVAIAAGSLSASRTALTIAVEDEDPALVRSTVEALGLWSRPNVSVPHGLIRLLGLDWW